MGGLALKHLNTERKEKAQYETIVKKVVSVLKQIEPTMQVRPIVAYGKKDTFGDADILCSTEQLDKEKVQTCMRLLGSKGMVYNGDHKGLGDVFSMEVDGFQVDLLRVPKAYMDCAFAYFAYNDLGNLMGRVAHKMGFKYGFLGLDLPLRAGTHQFESVKVSTDTDAILPFLGFDPVRHAQGFETLEEIFEYAKSSMYFNPDIYLLENQNAKARVRDAKRPTYQKFLTYIAALPAQHERFEWQREPELKRAQRAALFVKACGVFEHLYPSVLGAFETAAVQAQAREFLSVSRIESMSALKGGTKALGISMRYLRDTMVQDTVWGQSILPLLSVEEVAQMVHAPQEHNALDVYMRAPNAQQLSWLHEQLQWCQKALGCMDMDKDDMKLVVQKLQLQEASVPEGAPLASGGSSAKI